MLHSLSILHSISVAFIQALPRNLAKQGMKQGTVPRFISLGHSFMIRIIWIKTESKQNQNGIKTNMLISTHTIRVWIWPRSMYFTYALTRVTIQTTRRTTQASCRRKQGKTNSKQQTANSKQQTTNNKGWKPKADSQKQKNKRAPKR